MIDRPKMLEKLVGKTIKDVTICREGDSTVDVEFKFTDGSTVSVLTTARPLSELMFTCSNRDEDGLRERISK